MTKKVDIKAFIIGVLVLAVIMLSAGFVASGNQVSNTDPNRILVISNRSQAQLVVDSASDADVAIGNHQNTYDHRDLGVYRIEKGSNGELIAVNKKNSIQLFDTKSDAKMRTDRNLADAQNEHSMDLPHNVYKNLSNGMMMVVNH